MKYGKQYKIDETQKVTYLGDVKGKGIFLRNATCMPFVTWYYTLIDNETLDVRMGAYYSHLNEIFR